ncbi:MAG: glycosyl hydrolase 2 galactose-binding domain-containing protein, partial [Halanaerobiaceae bacterium]
MVKYISLNGDDWKLTGWWKNQWRMRESMELGEMQTAPVNTIPATVPGAVQDDLIKAGKLPDPNYGLNSNYGEWVNNREWFLDKKFLLPEDTDTEKYMLCFTGLDYHGEI